MVYYCVALTVGAAEVVEEVEVVQQCGTCQRVYLSSTDMNSR